MTPGEMIIYGTMLMGWSEAGNPLDADPRAARLTSGHRKGYVRSMANAGRPTSFKPEFIKQAEKLCTIGATDQDLADFFEVHIATLHRWKHDHEGFCDALKSGKEVADERVERSLYAKATGYSFDAVKVFQHEGQPVYAPYREHVPPSDTACIFWLKNRRPDLWRDRVTNEHTGPNGGAIVQRIERVVVDPKEG